jgi:hypothetical protein
LKEGKELKNVNQDTKIVNGSHRPTASSKQIKPKVVKKNKPVQHKKTAIQSGPKTGQIQRSSGGCNCGKKKQNKG